MKHYEFNVKGMHCSACELVIEKKIGKLKGVKKVDAMLNNNKVYVESEQELLIDDLNKIIMPHGYTLQTEASASTLPKYEIITAFGISLIIMVLFFLLQKSGIVNFINAQTVSLPVVFLFGVVASLSTCMAVVGGLVLSLSSTLSKTQNTKPIVAFHLSRLIGFFILGGLIGLIGSAFILNPLMIAIMNSILFIVMLIMGLNLLGDIAWLKNVQLRLPKKLGKKVLDLSEKQNILSATLAGAATFVLPCGFTQSMQLYALSSGNFVQGALIMFVFALGTFPVLALISFASVRFGKGIKSGLFYKTAGFLIILFAIFNLITGLIAIGIIPPLFSL